MRRKSGFCRAAPAVCKGRLKPAAGFQTAFLFLKKHENDKLLIPYYFKAYTFMKDAEQSSYTDALRVCAVSTGRPRNHPACLFSF